jgi:hypothetical protein
MDRDDFILTVYCLVCDQYRALFSEHPLYRGGFTPQLTDEEVITLEICGEYFKLRTDQDLFDYFRQHYQAWFPHLHDRSLFVRQVTAAIQQRLTVVSGQQLIPCRSSISCRYSFARSRAVAATAVSSPTPIMDIARPKT